MVLRFRSARALALTASLGLALVGLACTADTRSAAPTAAPAGSTVAWGTPAAGGAAVAAAPVASAAAPASASAPPAAAAPAGASPAAGRTIKAPSFAPAFAYSDGDTVWAVDAAGQAKSELIALARGSQTKYVAWSPDGKTIAFSALAPYVRGGNNGADLWTVGADGSSLKTVVSHEVKDAVLEFPTWSPDGKYLYFSRSVPIYEGDRYVRNDYTVERLNAESGAVDKLVTDAASPAISADGKTLAYLRIDGFQQILTASNLDGSGAHPVIPADQQPPFIWGPVFAPDGKTISFSAAGGASSDPTMPTSSRSPFERLLAGSAVAAHPVGGPWELFSIKVDGSDLRQITRLRDQYEEISHSWSPDGGRIAFVALGALNTIRPDGTDLKQLNPDMPFGEVSWSPRASGAP